MLKKSVRISVLMVLCMSLFTIYVADCVPGDMYCGENDKIEIKSLPMVKLTPAAKGQSRAVGADVKNLQYSAKLFGVIPLKTVNVSSDSVRKVAVAGTPFGIKLFSDGVMVVGFSDIQTKTGHICPARKAGLKLGDVIIKLDGVNVRSNSEVENYILKNGSKPVRVTFLREDMQMAATLAPVLDLSSQSWRTGMWVRDSSAGVGTMTFYDVQKGMFAGLGHGIKDTDTQKDIRLLSGEIVKVRITGCEKSKNGTAGELKGVFVSDFAMGRVWANSSNGVYGGIFSPPTDNIMDVASPNEIETGPAKLLTTIDGTVAREYDIVIEKVSLTGSNQNKNMVIRITDKDLLEATGGIVQGMSGSPIIQNGKLVGAVTHVFVNQVERGYAVFAQNMIVSMDNAYKVNKAG